MKWRPYTCKGGNIYSLDLKEKVFLAFPHEALLEGA